jgi:hypothetical protein
MKTQSFSLPAGKHALQEQSLAEDILRGRPRTKKEAYGIEPCHSCGRTFTQNSEGSTSTRLARDDGQDRLFCSDNCKDWYCDCRLIRGEIVRNPTFKEQQAKMREQHSPMLPKETKDLPTSFRFNGLRSLRERKDNAIAAL